MNIIIELPSAHKSTIEVKKVEQSKAEDNKPKKVEKKVHEKNYRRR
jgi:hypothetical protein